MKKTHAQDRPLSWVQAGVWFCGAMALLYPFFWLLRNHHPWNCFPLTYDESFFRQAAALWGTGQGYRTMQHDLPFDPGLNTGLPLGALAVALTRLIPSFATDLGIAGRLVTWVFFLGWIGTFILHWFRKKDLFHAIPLFLFFGALGLYLRIFPQAGYITFGFLGEFAALFIVLTAFVILERWPRYSVATSLAFVLAVAVKASFFSLYFAYLVLRGVSAFLEKKWKPFLLEAAVSLGALIALISFYSFARHQTPFEYLQLFAATVSAITGANPNTSGSALYLQSVGAIQLFFLALGAWKTRELFRQHRTLRLVLRNEMFWCFSALVCLYGILHGTVLGHTFFPKHSFVFSFHAHALCIVFLIQKISEAVPFLRTHSPHVAFFSVGVFLTQVPLDKKNLWNAVPLQQCAHRAQLEAERLMKKKAITDRSSFLEVTDLSYRIFPADPKDRRGIFQVAEAQTLPEDFTRFNVILTDHTLSESDRSKLARICKLDWEAAPYALWACH